MTIVVRWARIALVLAGALNLAGCAVDSSTADRALTGAAVGAAGGATIGLLTGGFVSKAATGAVAGAAGGFVYDQIKKSP